MLWGSWLESHWICSLLLIIRPCCQGTCLGLWTYHRLSQCWCPVPMSSLNTTQMPRIWDSTCGHIGVWGLCLYHVHIDPSDMCCHLGSWCHKDPSCVWGHVWVCGPAAVRVLIDVGCSCCHYRLYGSLGSGTPPKAMWRLKGHTTTGSMPI